MASETTVIKPTKEQILDAREKMLTFFQEDFKNKVKSHMDAGHTFMFGNSLWRLTETHPEIIKEYGIYVLMGSNRRYEEWGNIKDEFDVEPVRKDLTPILVSLAREVATNYYYKIIFTDKPKSDGNFKLKMDFKTLTATKKTSNASTETDTDSEGFKPVKRGVRGATNEVEKLKKEIESLKKKLSKK